VQSAAIDESDKMVVATSPQFTVPDLADHLLVIVQIAVSIVTSDANALPIAIRKFNPGLFDH